MGEDTQTQQSETGSGPPKKVPPSLIDKAKKEVKKIPVYIVGEVNRVAGDVKHVTKGELGKLSPDTQIFFANKAKDLATGKKGFGVPIPVPGVPNAALVVGCENFKDLGGEPERNTLTYEPFNW